MLLICILECFRGKVLAFDLLIKLCVCVTIAREPKKKLLKENVIPYFGGGGKIFVELVVKNR